MATTLCSPTSSSGDEPHEADAVFSQVMRATSAFTDAVYLIAFQHGDTAPESSAFVHDLQAIVSTEVLAWIWRWPS